MQPFACSRVVTWHASLEGGISHLRCRICIKFGLLVIQWKCVLSCLTWDYGLWGHSAVIPDFCVIPFFPGMSDSFLRSRGQGKDTYLNDSSLLFLGIKCSPKTTLRCLWWGNEQSEPWIVWANKGTTKSLKITDIQGSLFLMYLCQGNSMTAMNFVQTIACSHVVCSKRAGKQGEQSLKGFSYAWSLSGLLTFVCFRLFLLTVHRGYVLTLLNYWRELQMMHEMKNPPSPSAQTANRQFCAIAAELHHNIRCT